MGEPAPRARTMGQVTVLARCWTVFYDLDITAKNFIDNIMKHINRVIAGNAKKKYPEILLVCKKR